ncbi:hypothetical protein AUK15_00985 [Candidatus Nomurabacteria bacterium CG2_30_43_9]|uniref:Uncharacterized protein n=2 Tax=Parcubacteria group TaxID=1794811 RepID=A0A1J5GFY4_9BACT|nr:MAG: hypothetical protein AUK15_00985 [Candidatus Nomurabacteria bacterium CG2_30_43_9]
MKYNIKMKEISRRQGFTHQNFLKKNSGGFMQIVLLAIVIIAALGYFNIDLRTVFENPIVQKIWNIFVVGWTTYLQPFVIYLWTSFNGLTK